MNTAIAWMVLLLAASLGAAKSDPSTLYGTWRGDSICVVEKSACHDEKADYRFAGVPGKPGLVSFTAGKIVDGKVIVMGTIECQHDSDKGTLLCEYSHGVWRFQIDGDKMEGTSTLPDKTVFRRVTVKKQ